MFLSMVLLCLTTALASLLIRHSLRAFSGWLLVFVPLSIFVVLCRTIPAIASGRVLIEDTPWIASLGMSLRFRLDALSLLFALLVMGLGTLMVLHMVYAQARIPESDPLFSGMLLFLGGMLGLLLADNTLLLCVCWLLVLGSSYLLAGLNYANPAIRHSMPRVLILTIGGSLLLLNGFLLIGEMADRAGVAATETLHLESALLIGPTIDSVPLALAGACLVLVGSLIASAQVPLHGWLPALVHRSTPPVSSFHLVSMVLAGIYVLARLQPALSGSFIWSALLIVVGSSSLIYGAVRALCENDLRLWLVYVIINQAGMLVLLLGLGGPEATLALMTGLVAYGSAAGALALLAAIIAREADTCDLRHLQRLAQTMPVTGWLLALSAASLAGIPLWLGYITHGLLFDAVQRVALPVWVRIAVGTVSTIGVALGIAYNWRLVRSLVWRGNPQPLSRLPSEAPARVLFGPAVLASLSLMSGLPFAGLMLLSELLLKPAAAVAAGLSIETELTLWSGFDLTLLYSGLAILLGVICIYYESALIRAFSALQPAPRSEEGTARRWLASLQQTSAALSGPLRRLSAQGAVAMVVLAGVLLMGMSLVAYGLRASSLLPPEALTGDLLIAMLPAALVMIGGVVAVLTDRSRRVVVGGAAAVAGGLVVLFALAGAFDLALIQALVAVVSLTLLWPALGQRAAYQEPHSTSGHLAVSTLAAIGVGLLTTALILLLIGGERFGSLSAYYLANLERARGNNVVQVLLVDFRALDTLGAAVVLFLGALAVYRLRRRL